MSSEKCCGNEAMEFITEKDLDYFYGIDLSRTLGRYTDVLDQMGEAIDEVEMIRCGPNHKIMNELYRYISWSI